MNKILSLVLLAAILVPHAEAARRYSPFPPYIDKRFDDLETDLEAVGVARKSAKVVYNVASDGGSSTATKALGVTLPAGTIITGMYVYVNTAFTKAGGGAGVASLALQCAGTRDLMEYQNISALGAGNMYSRLMQGGVQGSSGSFIGTGAALESLNTGSVSTACEVTAVVRGDSGYEAYTAGKATAIIEYFNKD